MFGQQLTQIHTLHLASYFGLHRPVLNLLNHELGVPYIPIRYRNLALIALQIPEWQKTDYAIDLNLPLFDSLSPTRTF